MAIQKGGVRWKSRRPEGRRLRDGDLCDDAPMLAGKFGVGRDRSRRREVEIALEWKSERATGSGELEETHVTEFRFAQPEVAKAEGEINVRVELGEQPGGVAVRGEEFYDEFKVEALVLAIDGGALGASILEEFVALGGSD